jgi:UDP-N-acetylmuramoyl-L-alanyl-D-glutamate--2,6-diaminopimelate ligase
MKLHQLFSFFSFSDITNEQQKALDREVSGLFFDARLVQVDSVFVAIRGNEKDGHDFIEQALQNGAMAIVVENKSKVPPECSVLVLEVSDSRAILDHLASRFYFFPSHELICIGITGTNGKTSITYILEHILNQNKKLTGVIGTVNHRVNEKVWETSNTTPDPVTLQKRLREFLDAGAVCAALEVTSHALSQKRVDSVNFNTVVFTNLTLDHLDYHKTMQNYFETKQRLFTELMDSSVKKPKFAIVNIDDSYGRKLKIADDVVCWTYGKKESDFQFKILNMNFSETEFEIKTPVELTTLKLPLCGEHTIYNIIAGVAAAITCGVSLQQSFKALQSFHGVPGRLQKVFHASEKIVFVDYAHTPDALLNVLKTLQEIRKSSKLRNKIITVFGCGGDRDKSKRPIMAKIAEEQSDFVLITSDNPRTESPEVIVQEVAKGLSSGFANFQIEVDREKAIQFAIQMAHEGDVVLIAGKGHENYQIIGTEKRHFSDFEMALKYLK